jgi:hypothetical protein
MAVRRVDIDPRSVDLVDAGGVIVNLEVPTRGVVAEGESGTGKEYLPHLWRKFMTFEGDEDHCRGTTLDRKGQPLQMGRLRMLGILEAQGLRHQGMIQAQFFSGQVALGEKPEEWED